MSDHIEKIAKTCHEVNRLYCLSHGDFSQVPWDEAPDWQRKSVRSGVLFLMINKSATPESSHENWLRDKTADGWVYGAKKDEGKKTHPCMVSYSELPRFQRLKDRMFHTIVRSMSE